ncbi:MAG TPA: hypothetical protein VGF62_07040, partial [Rhizomicrobium sp.]
IWGGLTGGAAGTAPGGGISAVETAPKSCFGRSAGAGAPMIASGATATDCVGAAAGLASV